MDIRGASYRENHHNVEMRDADGHRADEHHKSLIAREKHVPKWPCNRPKCDLTTCRMTRCHLFDACSCEHCGESPERYFGDGRF